MNSCWDVAIDLGPTMGVTVNDDYGENRCLGVGGTKAESSHKLTALSISFRWTTGRYDETRVQSCQVNHHNISAKPTLPETTLIIFQTEYTKLPELY